MKKLGFLRIMITNQPDVAYGRVTFSEWEKIQRRVETLGFDDVFMCRHRTQDKCPMKKPSHLMLIAAADKWGIDPKSSYMIGDTFNDTLAGKKSGCTTILIKAPYNKGTKSDHLVKNFWEAARLIKTLNAPSG